MSAEAAASTRGAEDSLLLVDDDDNLRSRLARAMVARGYTVAEAATGTAALASAGQGDYAYAVVDLRLPDMGGLDVVRGIKSATPRTKVVVLTGYGSIATALEAVRLGAHDYLSKPVDADDVARSLTREAAPEPPPTVVPSLARVEWEHINRVLCDCEGNVTTASRVLGIHRRSLQRKLAKFPLSR
jgi:two-component system response regulator RegA